MQVFEERNIMHIQILDPLCNSKYNIIFRQLELKILLNHLFHKLSQGILIVHI